MKRNIRRIICIAVVVMTLMLSSGIAFAYYDDGFPYGGWSQFRVLKDGKGGNDVRLLQQYLLMTGYAPGTVDGGFGSNTVAAVKRYQSAWRLSADGIVGANTWSKMREQTSYYGTGYGTDASYTCQYATSYWVWNDRFYHHNDGSWWVSYGNTNTDWSPEVLAWQP